MKNLNKLYWLKQEKNDIENEIKELTVLKAFEITGMPSGNSVSSPVEEFNQSKEKLAIKLEKKEKQIVNEIDRLEKCLDEIEDDEIRSLARKRYRECKSFETIGNECHMDRRTVSRKLKKYFGKDEAQ